jgi:hypothetical protein
MLWQGSAGATVTEIMNPDRYQAGMITYASVAEKAEGPKGRMSENDATFTQLRTQLDTDGDQSTQLVPANNRFEVTNAATQVKVPKGGRASGTFGYEPIGEEHMTLRKDALKTIHVHTDESKKTAVPTEHDFKAVRDSGGRPMYFSSRYLARHGKDPEGRRGNYIILRSTGKHHYNIPTQEYGFDPRLTMPPLRR